MSAESSAQGLPARRLGVAGNSSYLGRRFWYLWGTFACASTGDGFAFGAVPLLAVVVDHSPVAVSAVVAADKLPWLIGALPAGSLSDRYERGRVMAAVNISRGILLTLMAVIVGLHRMDVPLLLVLVFANGSARTIYYSASQAVVPELVPTDSLARANGILTGTEAAAEHLVGPILGTLAFVARQALPFAAEASAVGTSGLALLRFRTQPPTAETAKRRGFTWEGVRMLFRDPRMRVLVTLIAALSGLQGLVTGVMVLVATHDWGVRPSLYGLFLAVGAVGNVPGAMLADKIVTRLGSAATLLAAAVVSGLGYVVMGLTSSWLVAGAGFLVGSFAVAAGSVVAISLRQRLTPNEVMGRVGSAWRGIIWGAAPVGALLAGGVALLGGLRLPVLLAGVAQCLVAAALAAPLCRRLGSRRPPAHRRRRGSEGTEAVTGEPEAAGSARPGPPSS